ncbi:hypothetical protein Cni_G27110 [Canna indica]|uniref:Uncharacterized protein n=1 Tax=Canna indica TaxID=4628 RepID=A0AAQ3QR33_9LILI|nr:hypothetical protein Cni_G27110 [Canna indica]
MRSVAMESRGNPDVDHLPAELHCGARVHAPHAAGLFELDEHHCLVELGIKRKTRATEHMLEETAGARDAKIPGRLLALSTSPVTLYFILAIENMYPGSKKQHSMVAKEVVLLELQPDHQHTSPQSRIVKRNALMFLIA